MTNPRPKTPARPETDGDARADDAMLPHERDESTGQTPPEPDAVMHQAKRDLDAGLVDTDMNATPGLDAERRKRLVPTPTDDGPTSPPEGAPKGSDD